MTQSDSACDVILTLKVILQNRRQIEFYVIYLCWCLAIFSLPQRQDKQTTFRQVERLLYLRIQIDTVYRTRHCPKIPMNVLLGNHRFHESFYAALFYGITRPQPTAVWHFISACWGFGADPRYSGDTPFRAWALGLDGMARHFNGGDVFVVMAIVANARCQPRMAQPSQLAGVIGDHRF